MTPAKPPELMQHAVKALIYRDNGQILLQQRDNQPGLPFPGYWTFFGGRVEPNETFEIALRRELSEELGEVGEQLFSWIWRGGDSAENHVFPVHCLVNDDVLVLGEGQAMKWVCSDELKTIRLIPGLLERTSLIEAYIASRSS